MSLEWKDIKDKIGAVAPMLGALIGGPAGGAIGAIISSALGTENTPEAIALELNTNPDALVKLRQIEKERQVELQTLTVDLAKAEIAASAATMLAVNQTMQAEAQSNHWPTYSWRPFIGFIFGFVFAGVYFVLPLLKLPVPVIPTEAWLAIGGVLGVASWFRGKAQSDPMNPMANKG